MRLMAAALALIAAQPALSSTSFFDGFEGETAGGSILNYAGFANWSVSDGTVDLVRSGDYGVTCRTGSYCVDLDGSTNQPGIFVSRWFDVGAGDIFSATWWISGNQRGGTPDVLSFGIIFDFLMPGSGAWWSYFGPGFAESKGSFFYQNALGAGGLPTAPAVPFGQYGIAFRALSDTRAALYLLNGWTDEDGNDVHDNRGLVLDDVAVRVAPVPEAETWAMLVTGFGVLGAALRRRQRLPA